MPRGYLVYNPAAGRYPSKLLCERAAAVLRANDWQIQLEQSRGGSHITELAKHAADHRMDAFFIAGGDGSINCAIASLIGTETALGILPSGTANVWAQELGLPGLTWTRWMALEVTARRLANAKVYHVDVGFCNKHPFLLWAGVGLDAFIVHRIEPRPRWEKNLAVVQYLATAVWQASFWHGMNLRVEVEGKEIQGHLLLAVVSNVHLYAGGIAQLSPNARLDDGQMDLWLFEGDTLRDAIHHAWELWSGSHVDSRHVHQIQFSVLQMEADSPVFIQLDGEPYETDRKLTIEVKPRALPVLIPEETPHPLFNHR